MTNGKKPEIGLDPDFGEPAPKRPRRYGIGVRICLAVAAIMVMKNGGPAIAMAFAATLLLVAVFPFGKLRRKVDALEEPLEDL